MIGANMDKAIVYRLNIYMETIYSLSNGYVLPQFLDDLPVVFRQKINVEKTFPFVHRLPLFEVRYKFQ